MIDDATRARQALELARTTSARLWAEHSAYCKTLDPAPGVVGAEELRRLREASEWQGKVYAAEHALFRAEHGALGIVGSHEEYQWLTMVDRDITSLLNICPEIVLGKYLAVTRIDGGSLRLKEQEKAGGWWTAEGGRVFQGAPWGPPEYRDDWKVAYSPRITSIHGLPNETHDECCDGYNEWYVSAHQAPAEEIESFVNWMGFRLYDPKFQWCADRFWSQIARTKPESYIADGTVFTVVTRNPAVFNRIISGYLAAVRRLLLALVDPLIKLFIPRNDQRRREAGFGGMAGRSGHGLVEAGLGE